MPLKICVPFPNHHSRSLLLKSSLEFLTSICCDSEYNFMHSALAWCQMDIWWSYKVRQKNYFFCWHVGRKDASFGDKSLSVVTSAWEISVISSSSFYLQLSQANMMLSLGADPPSPMVSSWCFILFAVSRSVQSPFGGRFYMWEGRAAGKPRDSAAHLGVGTSLLPAPHGCLCKSVARSVFWEPFTGRKITFIWQLQLHLVVTEFFAPER